jgi:hypothetical protein
MVSEWEGYGRKLSQFGSSYGSGVLPPVLQHEMQGIWISIVIWIGNNICWTLGTNRECTYRSLSHTEFSVTGFSALLGIVLQLGLSSAPGLTSLQAGDYLTPITQSPTFQRGTRTEYVTVVLLTGPRHKKGYNNDNSVALIREQTIPTELPPLVGEVSASFCG